MGRTRPSQLCTNRLKVGFRHPRVYGEIVLGSSVRLCAGALLDDFGQFNHVPERIGEESDLAANLVDLKRFGKDIHVAPAQLVHSGVDIGDGQAEMMVTGMLQAVAQIPVNPYRVRAQVTAGEQFDHETIVIWRREIGELLVIISPCVNDAPVELIPIPFYGGVPVGHTDRNVMSAHICEER